MSRLKVTLKVEPDGLPVTVVGRDAWMLKQLLAVGAKGLTSIHNPAPRISHYVFKLRRAGLNIETIDEQHGGPFAGSHARYVLKSPVVILADNSQTATEGVAA